MVRRLAVSVVGGIALALACPTPNAHADSTRNAALAEALFREGRDLVKAGRWADACPKFAESQRLDPGTGTLLNLAGCYEAIQKYTNAWALYREVQTLAGREGHREREQFAANKSRELEAKFGRVTVVVESKKKDLVVTSDGEPLGEATWGTALPMDPGAHTIVAAAPGFNAFKQSIEVTAGSMLRVPIPELTPAPSATPATTKDEPAKPSPLAPPAPTMEQSSSASRTLGWVGVGVGGAAVGAGALFGFIAKSKNDDANSGGHCTQKDCDARGVALLEDATTAGNLSTILFIGGAVVAVTGVVLVLTAPSAKRSDVAQRWLGAPGSFVF